MHAEKPKPPFPWHDPFQVSLIGVNCPVCGAVEGVPCEMRGGARNRLTHLRRADRAIKAINRERYGR